MNEEQFTIVGIGEVLWDVLPDGRQLGGAPANFAYISNALGNNGVVLSRVGDDEFGRGILDELQAKDISTENIQIDAETPTGIVNVKLENGQPTYEIVENAAWDFLEFSDDWGEIARNCDAVCFGSLAQRNEVSRKTIRRFVGETRENCLRIFDVNLRQNYFSAEILDKSLQTANILKLNYDELPVIFETLKIKGENEVRQTKNLTDLYDLKMVCLTRGAGGSILLTKKELAENDGKKTKVKDTIGAGDAFTAAMTNGILRDWSLKKINNFANKVGAFVASQTGAMPSFESFRI